MLTIVSLLLVLGVVFTIWPKHPPSLPESQAGMPEHESSLIVHGQVFQIKTPDQLTARDILVADGPKGFYWSLPQNPGETGMPYITEPAVIHYTPYQFSIALIKRSTYGLNSGIMLFSQRPCANY